MISLLGPIAAQATTVTVSGLAADKIYDGTNTATVDFSGANLNGVAEGDDVTLVTNGYTASFDNRNAGNGKTVTVGGLTLGGANAGNYTLVQPTFSANITQRPLGIYVTAQDKTYDATTNVSVALFFTNLVAGDNVLAAYDTANFADKNAGPGKTVTVDGLFIVGTAAGNYNLTNTTANTTAAINPKILRVAAFGVDKQYDATTAATVNLYDNHLQGDSITTTYGSAAFADPYVGTGKSIGVTGIAISPGGDAGNYTLNGVTTASAQASITPRTLNVTAHGQDKTYDGTTNATVTLTDDHLDGDSITVSFSGAGFSDDNVGTGKAVNVVGIQITGSNAGNYELASTTASTTASIASRTLTVVAIGQNRTYDGTTNATVTFSDNHLAGDTITVTNASASFGDKYVGTGKTVTITGIGITGASAGNYSLATTTSIAPANITARPLAVAATGQNKTYDGTVNATVTLNDNRVTNDQLTDSYGSASFADPNAGTNKTVNVIGIQVTGSDSANYTLANTATNTTANISSRTLTVAASGQDKVYDGKTSASVTLSDDHLAGDTLLISSNSANFADKRVGSGKTITVTGISIGGGSAGNYTLAGTTATATANITSYSLTVTATGINKVYDGTVNAAVSLQDNRVSGDVLTVSYGSANFVSSSVGNGITVNVAGISIAGTDAGNYTLANTAATTTANITTRTPSLALASSENPSGFRDAISFTATLPADATGTITFSTNSVAFSSGSVDSGAFASGTFTNFLRGTNVITASYSGDGNYAAASTTLSQIVTNHPPLTGFFSFSVTNGNSLKVKISDLLGAVVDPDGDAVSFAGVNPSTNGVALPTNSTLIFYHNTNYVNDKFSYVVADGYGGVSTGQVFVVSVLAPFTGQTTGQLSISGGTQTVKFFGVPGFAYVIQRSVNMVSWTDIATVTAAADGSIQATDNFSDLGGPPASAFYRLKWQP